MPKTYSPVPNVFFAPPMIEDHTAAYVLKGECFLDDIRYEEGNYVYWPDTPNLDMVPVNAKAEEAMKAYVKHLDECGRKAAEKTGSHYASLEDAYENARKLERQESRKVGLISSAQVPLMQANKKIRSEKIDTVAQAAAPTGRQAIKKTREATID